MFHLKDCPSLATTFFNFSLVSNVKCYLVRACTSEEVDVRRAEVTIMYFQVDFDLFCNMCLDLARFYFIARLNPRN